MSAKPRKRSGHRGYTLVALMVGITVMTVLIAAVLPLASTQTQRDREEELIFRGGQIVEGIRIFRRSQGRYPISLKEMFEIRPRRALRKMWKDPITNSDEWGLIHFGQALGATTPIAPRLPRGVPTPVPSPTPTPLPFSPDEHKGDLGLGAPVPRSSGGGGPAGPVIGVYSTSRKKSFRSFQGHNEYDEWKFTEATMGLQGTGMGPGVAADTPPGGGVPVGVGGGPVKR